VTQKKTIERLWITSASPMWRFLGTTTRILTSQQRGQFDFNVPTSIKEDAIIILSLSLVKKTMLNSLFDITS